MKRIQILLLFFVTLAFLATGSLAFAEPKALQTQYGPDGIEVDLIRVKKGGKVLSVAFNFRNTGTSSSQVTYLINDVHYIDNTKSQKYEVLKDAEGKWISGPISHPYRDDEKAYTHFYLSKGKSAIAWYKFPAPSEDVTSIQINLPQISPFDDVELAK